MPIETTRFDPVDYLRTPAAIAAYVADALETGDVDEIADALGIVARAGNLSGIARNAGVHRQTLYKSFTPGGNPALGTVMKVLKTLGVQLTTVPIATGSEPAG